MPVEAVSQVSHLLKPDVVDKMIPLIQGITSGAGITRFSIKMMTEYGLYEAGYRFQSGTEEDCFKSFEQAVARKEWIVVPLWKPQFLLYRHHIREMVEPKGLLGIVDRAVLLLRDDKKALFTPAQLAKLDRLRFSNEIIAELDYRVRREDLCLDDVIRQWLAEHDDAS